MNDEKFYKEIDLLFEKYLSSKENVLKLRIKNIEKNTILSETDMNYSKVFFDSDLNIYKIDGEGKIVKVENGNFESVVMKKSDKE